MFSQLVRWGLRVRHPSPRRRDARLTRSAIGLVEQLEERTLLSAATFSNGDDEPSASRPERTPRIVNGSSTSAFSSVGIVGDRSGGFCTGTLIAPQYVLTAGHCADGMSSTGGRFTVAGRTYSTSRIFVHPSYNSRRLGSDSANDLAIMQLSSSVIGVTPSPLFRSVPVVGQTLTLVGFGAGGTGQTGHNGDFGTKRTGTSPIERVTPKLIRWEFDSDDESNTAPGDSGGPAFLLVGGEYQIAGVTSGGDRNDAGFGDSSFDTRVDAYATWIDSITGLVPPSNPEPDPQPDPAPDADPKDDDHADSPGPDATVITIDNGAAQATGTLEQVGDRDLFQVHFETAVHVSINLTGTNSLDTYLRLYDETGTLISENDDASGSLNSRVSSSLDPGVYYISAGSFGDRSAGSYSISIETTQGDDHGDEQSAATIVSLGGGAIAGNIERSGDVDYFVFIADRNGRAGVDLAGLTNGLDTLLAVYNSRGGLIAINDDYAFSLDSHVRIRIRAGQKYFVQASAYGSGTGAYSLNISLADRSKRSGELAQRSSDSGELARESSRDRNVLNESRRERAPWRNETSKLRSHPKSLAPDAVDLALKGSQGAEERTTNLAEIDEILAKLAM